MRIMSEELWKFDCQSVHYNSLTDTGDGGRENGVGKTWAVKAQLQQFKLHSHDKQQYASGQTKKEMTTPNGQNFEIYTR